MAQAVAALIKDILQRSYSPTGQGKVAGSEEALADAALAGLVRSTAMNKSMASVRNEVDSIQIILFFFYFLFYFFFMVCVFFFVGTRKEESGGAGEASGEDDRSLHHAVGLRLHGITIYHTG
jgi:hypothetical protein